jgi:LacI family transcriptional regulator
MRATISDVAQRAGTSPATVSRVLNRSGYVSEETQRRVEQAVAELEYEPNRMARQMKGKPTRLIGLVLPYVDSPNMASLTQFVADALRIREYDLMLCISNEDSETDLRHLINLRNQRADGILYSHPANGSNSRFLRDLAQHGIPVVEILRHRETDILHAVIGDGERAGYRLTKYLLDKGHRRIGFIAGWPHISATFHHLAGYGRALGQAGVSQDPELVRTGTSLSVHGEESANVLMDLAAPPTALFCIGDYTLRGVISALQRRGLHVPDDVSLVSNSPADWLRVNIPPITAAGTHMPAMACAAVDVLLRCIEARADVGHPITHFLDASLIEGGSVKALGAPSTTLQK